MSLETMVWVVVAAFATVLVAGLAAWLMSSLDR